MKTRTKLLLDQVVAAPVAWGFNLSARILGATLHRDHSVVDSEVRCIVVVKLLGMGSIIQTTPFLRALKQRFPNARLVLLTTAGHRPLVERIEVIDEALYLDDRTARGLLSGGIRHVLALWKLRPDLYFDLEVYSAATSILGLLSLARNRYGFYRTSARFKRGIFTHLVYFNIRMPIARVYLQLHVAAGGDPVDTNELGPIAIRPADRAAMAVKRLAGGVPADTRYIVLNPNASDLLLERRWPLDHFAAAMHMLAERDYHMILIGAPNEAEHVSAIADALSPLARAKTTNLAGKLSLSELFALIADAHCVITNDTGPMHIAYALNRPTVCLFGPSTPECYGIARDNTEVLYHQVFCSPCAHELDQPPCNGNNVCMQLITPAEVVLSVERVVTATGRSHRSLPVIGQRPIIYVDGVNHGLGVVNRELPDAARNGRSR